MDLECGVFSVADSIKQSHLMDSAGHEFLMGFNSSWGFFFPLTKPFIEHFPEN